MNLILNPISESFYKSFTHPYFTRPHKRSPKAHSKKVYKDFKQAVLERDNYKCVKCGTHLKIVAKGRHKKTNLTIHHVLPYSLYPKRRIDPANGITLCCDCNSKYHNEFPIDMVNPMTLQSFMMENAK